jgi:tetratricopeptide (TPR) repeat protein
MHPSATSTARLNRLLIFVELDATNLKLRKDAIRAASSVGYWDTARKLIDDGLKTCPQEPFLLAHSGCAYLQAHHYVDAEEAFSSALSHGLDGPELHYNLAFARFGQRRYEEALASLTAPLAEAVPIALLLRAHCLHRLGHSEEAILACTARLAIEQQDAETHGLLGLLRYEQQQADAAMPHVAAALRQNPQQLEAMLVSASLESGSQNHDVARVLFETLLQVHPRCDRAWLGVALIELTELFGRAARRDLAQPAACMPDYVAGHVQAWVNTMRGDVVAAELGFSRALSANRDFAEMHGGLAVIAGMQGREVDARVSIRRALRLDPQSTSALYAGMLLLQRANQHDQAQKLLHAVLARHACQTRDRARDLTKVQVENLRARLHAEEGEAPDLLH